jgi:hypothetical protein
VELEKMAEPLILGIKKLGKLVHTVEEKERRKVQKVPSLVLKEMQIAQILGQTDLVGSYLEMQPDQS